MIAYKANTLKWTHENGFERTDNVIIGYLNKKVTPWTIAYQIEKGTGAVKSCMVDKDTIKKIKVRKVTDEMKKAYWFKEEEG